MIYIATTTINKPTKALKLFAKNRKCKLIVALDKKSKKFKLDNSIVLSVKYQEKMAKVVKIDWMELYTKKEFCNFKAFERELKLLH